MALHGSFMYLFICLPYTTSSLTTSSFPLSHISLHCWLKSKMCIKGSVKCRYRTRLAQGFCCPRIHTPSSGWRRSGSSQAGVQCWGAAHWQSIAPPLQILDCLAGLLTTAALLPLPYHHAGHPAATTIGIAGCKFPEEGPHGFYYCNCTGSTEHCSCLVHGTEYSISNFIFAVEVPCCYLQIFIQ
jgi:hypothetical protein